MLRVLLLLLCLSPAWPGPVFADSEQDEAKSALERGEIKPLDRVLAAVRAAVPRRRRRGQARAEEEDLDL